MEKFVLKYILIALTCIVSYNAGNAQTAPADRMISVNISGCRLDEALQAIASAGGFSFSYNSDCIPFDSIVSIGVRNHKVRSVLRSILPARIQIKEKGNYVILTCKIPKNTRSRHNAGSTYIISGYIIDRYSGQRIPMASVYDKTNYALALTNDYGYYTIQVPGNTGAVRLMVSKKYYLDTVIVVKPADSIKDLCIQLTPQMERVPTIQPSEVYSGKSIEDIGIVNALVPDKQLNQTRNNPQKLKKGFNLSLVPGLSTNRLWSGNTTNVFALNILIGYSSGITGVEIGGLFNIDKSDVKGVQISGLGNIVGGRTEGVQAGGLFNFCLGKVYGP